jgi:hypothetical protein
LIVLISGGSFIFAKAVWGEIVSLKLVIILALSKDLLRPVRRQLLSLLYEFKRLFALFPVEFLMQMYTPRRSE